MTRDARATVDLWKWFHDCERDARIRGDRERAQLVDTYRQGWAYLRKEPQQSLLLFSAGAELARRLGEPCWELFHEYWQCEAHIFYLRNLNDGLDQAVKTVALAQKYAAARCPVMARAYRILADAYYRIDAEGYADNIRETLAYMEQNIPLDDDTFFLLQRRRAGLHYTFDEWDDAEREALRYLDLVQGNAYRESDAFSLLYRIAYHKKQYPRAYEFILQGEAAARRARLDDSAAFALLAQAQLKQKLGEPQEAAALYRRAMAFFKTNKLPRSTWHYSVICAYHELRGDPKTALRLRDEQLAALENTGHHQFEGHCRLQRCRLLGRMGKVGKPLKTELAATRALASKLKKPGPFLEKLQRIEQGEYSDE